MSETLIIALTLFGIGIAIILAVILIIMNLKV